MKHPFEKASVGVVTSDRLAVGEHLVRLIEMRLTDSFTQFNGLPKTELPSWANSCPQAAITVVAVGNDEHGKPLTGSLTDRLNGIAFGKFVDLPEVDQNSGDYENIDGWACYTDKKSGDKMRLVDKQKSLICDNIRNQFARALKMELSDEEGAFMRGVAKAIANETSFRITVANKPYDGKDQRRITRYRQAVAVPTEADFED